MAKIQKKTNRGFAGFWGKSAKLAKPRPAGKPAGSATQPKAQRPQELARKRFGGPAHLVAAEHFWGPGQLWLHDEAAERELHWRAQKAENIGILAAGLGARASRLAAQVPGANLFEFDWRADVLAWRNERDHQDTGEHGDKASIYEINHGVALPPPVRCQFLLASEPVFVQGGPGLFRWARVALKVGGIMELDELVIDSPEAPTKERSSGWMPADRGAGQWLRLEEQSNILRRHGFHLGKVRERTGLHLRALRLSLERAGENQEVLNEAIKLVPELQNVTNHFNCEQKAAKNRLKALEHGDLAVYRIEVIKPRAEELI